MAVVVNFKDSSVKVFDEATHYEIGTGGYDEVYNIYEIGELIASVNMNEVKFIEKDNFKGEEV